MIHSEENLEEEVELLEEQLEEQLEELQLEELPQEVHIINLRLGGQLLEKHISRRLISKITDMSTGMLVLSEVEELMVFFTITTYLQITTMLEDITPHSILKFTITVMDITSTMVNMDTTRAHPMQESSFTTVEEVPEELLVESCSAAASLEL